MQRAVIHSITFAWLICHSAVLGQQLTDLPTEATVALIEFETSVRPPAFDPPAKFATPHKQFLKIAGESRESSVVNSGLVLAAFSRILSSEDAQALAGELAPLYRALEADPRFAALPSSLPFCFADKPTPRGQYVLVRPAKVDVRTPAIVFLHGFGGGFKLYPWLLSQEFPDAVLILPMWRETWRDGQAGYVHAAIADAQQRLGVQLQRPWLIGLSDGGVAAFRFFNAAPQRFSGLISLASSPEDAVAAHIRSDAPILLINGTVDDRFPIANVRRRVDTMRPRTPNLSPIEIEADHFLMLTHRQACFDAIRQVMKADPAAAP